MKAHCFKNNIYMIKLLWRLKKSRVVCEFLNMGIGRAYEIFFDIIFLRFLVESMETGRPFSEIMTFLVGVVACFALPAIFQQWYGYVYRPKTDTDIFGKVNAMLFEKATQVELECYENTEFYNQFTLAMKDCETRFTQVGENLCAIVTSLLAGIFSLYYMYTIDPFVIVFIAGPIIGNFVFGKISNEINFRMNKECVPYNRKMDYVNRVIYLADYAKELRMSNVFSVLKKLYRDGFGGVTGKLKEYRIRRAALALIRNIFTFVVIFQGVMIYSLYRTMVTHEISLSGFTVLFSAMVTVAWTVIGCSNAVVKSFEDSLYIANLREFLAYEPVIHEKQGGKMPEACRQDIQKKQKAGREEVCGQGIQKEQEGRYAGIREVSEIAFQDVSFVYKGQDAPTLKHISLSIRRGEKIAIVGHNGAGKTTLVKLLLRLYDPAKGQVLYFGENVKELDLQAYRRLFGTAFQDYQVFSMTVAENVLMRKPQDQADYKLVEEVLRRTGVWEKICSLPHGMDTILTKEFAQDGAVLSGGELQKIAVARAFAREYEIAVFDEPSSALDPVAEYRLYENILEACRDRTVVFISHRLSTAVLADRIYLFENGEIAEQGSHQELMELDGKYADMFRKQAENYQEKDPGATPEAEGGEA